MSSRGAKKIRTHNDLEVYASAMKAAMRIYECSKSFPIEERYSLTDQIRRSSRSVCANLAEAWRKRRYEAAFIAKISDAEAEAAETQVWLEFAARTGNLDRGVSAELHIAYDSVLSTLVGMIHHHDTWVLRK
jgi:four helix bundle protein